MVFLNNLSDSENESSSSEDLVGLGEEYNDDTDADPDYIGLESEDSSDEGVDNHSLHIRRFSVSYNFFYIADNRFVAKPGHSNYDPCGKFAPLLEHANRIFRTHYIPYLEISVDESLIGTKSHSQILQYLANEHHHR
ncbi:zinc finger protein [Homalodisca vitripennis]|nr:zinc finger protein [Homalodisca vitripennis]